MSDSVQSRSEGILRDNIDNTSIYPHKKGKSRLEDLLIELLEEGGGGGSSTAYATALSLSIDSSTYVMTAQLLNKDGDPLGTAQTVDLPLESVVVGAAYDTTTKSIILTLQSGSTTSVPVGDLVAGLVSTSDLETALATKQDTISDLSTIRSNATSGAEAAEVVTGINSTANSYIKMKSGQREYLATTVPTGDIPTGSVAMGFDEGTWTYKSGTKVSEGEPTANEFTGDISQFDNQGGTGSTYNYFKLTGDYTITLTCKDDCFSPTGITIGLNAEGGVATGGYTTFVAQRGNYTQGQIITGKTSDNGYQYVYIYGGSTTLEWIVAHFDIMLNKGNTALPYEPYGKKFPFYANGQSLADYTIYGNTGGVGEKTANLTDTRNFVNSTTDTRDYFQARLFSGQTISDQKIDSTGRKNLSVVLPAGEHTLRLRHSGANTDINIMTYSVVLTKETAFNCSFDVIGYNPLTVGGLVLDNIMLNEGDTALPYEPYGYKIPVGCGGQTTNIYIDSPLDDGDSIDYTTSQTAIPTTDGANTLICDTTVQPSKVSLTYTGWHSDLDDTTARIEALENAPAPSGGMTYDTLYEGTTASSYPYPLSHHITDYKFVIIAVGYSNIYTNTVIPVAVWSTVTSGGNSYDITVDTAQLRVNIDSISPRSANNRIVYGVYGIK